MGHQGGDESVALFLVLAKVNCYLVRLVKISKS